MPEPSPSQPSDVITRLAAKGLVVPPERSMSEALVLRGPLTGPVTDIGTRALAETRAERG